MNFKPLAYILLATSSLTACTMAPVKEQKIEPFVLGTRAYTSILCIKPI